MATKKKKLEPTVSKLEWMSTPAQTIILEKIVKLTPIVEAVYLYPRSAKNEKKTLVVHFITDDGKKNSIIRKLWDKCKGALQQYHEQEAIGGLEKLEFEQTAATSAIPAMHRCLYAREVK